MIRHICRRHIGFGADGLILLKNSPDADFEMVFYNPDGTTGMMCGNGGRCAVAFAETLGLGTPGKDGTSFRFEAVDGIHDAQILMHDGDRSLVRISIPDVAGIRKLGDDEYFVKDGTNHYVRFVPYVHRLDVVHEGRLVRYSEQFAPEGTNADFVSDDGIVLAVRTYERGVEDETLACGTGIVAAALAGYIRRGSEMDGKKHSIVVHARIANLRVEFVPHAGGAFSDIWLTGPAEYVGEVSTSDSFFAADTKEANKD